LIPGVVLRAGRVEPNDDGRGALAIPATNKHPSAYLRVLLECPGIYVRPTAVARFFIKVAVLNLDKPRAFRWSLLKQSEHGAPFLAGRYPECRAMCARR